MLNLGMATVRWRIGEEIWLPAPIAIAFWNSAILVLVAFNLQTIQEYILEI